MRPLNINDGHKSLHMYEYLHIILRIKRQISPVTGLKWPRGLQEITGSQIS